MQDEYDFTGADVELIDILKQHYRPLEPRPTDASARVERLSGIRAVLFDLYGTLFISGSGEVGTTRQAASLAAIEGAAQAMGVPFEPPLADATELMQQAIRREHAERREQGVSYPEIQVADIWRSVFAELLVRGDLAPQASGVLNRLDWRRLAVEYEARANPCWPMPEIEACLGRLREAGLLLGIVSNAQFYTPLLFPALLGRTLEECGFERHLCLFSFEHGVAKPGTRLYELAAGRLAERDIEPAEVLYVGNDMLNDIFPAAALGFRTALFAGDARSLRWREDDSRLAAVSADLILTDLAQLPECPIIA